MRYKNVAFDIRDLISGKTAITGGLTPYDAALKHAADKLMLNGECVPADYVVRETLKMLDTMRAQTERQNNGRMYGGNKTMHAAFTFDKTFGPNSPMFAAAKRAERENKKNGRSKMSANDQRVLQANKEARGESDRYQAIMQRAQQNQKMFTDRQKAPGGRGALAANSTVGTFARMSNKPYRVTINGRVYEVTPRSK